MDYRAVILLLRAAGRLMEEGYTRRDGRAIYPDGMCAALAWAQVQTTGPHEAYKDAKRVVMDLYWLDAPRNGQAFWFAPEGRDRGVRAIALYLAADVLEQGANLHLARGSRG